MPKFNLYQSLHTTVIGPSGQADRGADPHAHEMHQRAEWGVASALGVQGSSVGKGRNRSNGRACDDDGQERSWTGSTGSSTGRRRSAIRRSSCQNLKTGPRARRGLRVHAEAGKVDHAARRVPRRSTSPTRSTPRSDTRVIGSKRQQADSCRSIIRCGTSGDTVRDPVTSKVEDGRSVAGLAAVRRVAPRRRTRSRQWFSRERRVDMIEAGSRRAHRRRSGKRGVAGPEGVEGVRPPPGRDHRGPRTTSEQETRSYAAIGEGPRQSAKSGRGPQRGTAQEEPVPTSRWPCPRSAAVDASLSASRGIGGRTQDP